MTDKHLQLRDLAHSAMMALLTREQFSPIENSEKGMEQWVSDLATLSHSIALRMMEVEAIVVGEGMVEGLEESKDDE